MNQSVNNQRPQARPQQVQARKQPVQNGKSPYTESWVRIRSIKNGIITLPNREMVTGVKIDPRNIFILDQIQQDSILNALKNCYNTFNFEWWLIAADRPVDISVYISQLELMLNQPLDQARRKLVMQDIEKANMFINNQVVDTEYYILFKEKNPDEIGRRIRLLINGLASCGLNSSQTTNEDLRTILDNFLNGGVRTEFGTVVVE